MTESGARRAFHAARTELQAAITKYHDARAQAQCAQAVLHQAVAQLDAAVRAFDIDPETAKLRALLETWHSAFGSKPTTVGAAIQRSNTQALLAMAMDAIAGQNGTLNARILGRWLERVQGRIADGKCFARVGHRQGLLHWAVYCPQPEASEHPALPVNESTETPHALATPVEDPGRRGRESPSTQRAHA